MRRAFLWLLAAFILGPDCTSAQSWPSRPVRMIVPQAAGGMADIVARVISSPLARELGQQVLVDNRAGDATLGAQAAARAQADGYTYLFAPASVLAVDQYMAKILPYSPEDPRDRGGRPGRPAPRAGGELAPPHPGAAGGGDVLRDLAGVRIQRLVRGGRADRNAACSDRAHEPRTQPHPPGRSDGAAAPGARPLHRGHRRARGDRRVPGERARVLEPRRAGAEDRAGVARGGAGLDVGAGRTEDTISNKHGEDPMPQRLSPMYAMFIAALALAASSPVSAQQKGGKHHTLAATLETVQWGWLDPDEPPKLKVNSGDTISIETMMHSHDKIKPGITMDEIIALRKANPGGGPHSMTGPIYVEGAEPGDVLEVRIRKIVPKPFGVNFNLPGKDFPTIGALASEMPDGFVRFMPFDMKTRTAEFKPGITIDLKPFPGTLAVGIDPNDPSPRKGGVKDNPMAPVSTLRPWKNGSNMDINELQAGSTVFLPVFLKGGLIWTGDSHCRQGNGEVNLTALECSFKEIVIQPIVRKDLKLEWPRIETRTHWISVGFDEDLNKAMVNAVREAVDFLVAQKRVPLTRYEAYSLVSMVGDCRVSQVVDVRKGVHCMIPKSVFTKK